MKDYYYIARTVGKITDTLKCLWEGNDLPTFMRDGNPYFFTCRHEAQRVLCRLEARGMLTMDTPKIPSQPITYEIVHFSISESDAIVNDRPEQHLACFL